MPFILWIIVLLLLLVALSLSTRWGLAHLYRKVSRQDVLCSLTAEEVALAILDRREIEEVDVQAAGDIFGDRYHPEEGHLWLSEPGSFSLPDVGIAAHEAWHAVQAAEGGLLFRLNLAVAPYLETFGQLSLPLVLAGVLFYFPLIWGGLGLYLLAVSAGFATFGFELNANRRAVRSLRRMECINDDQTRTLRNLLSLVALRRAAILIGSPGTPFLTIFQRG